MRRRHIHVVLARAGGALAVVICSLMLTIVGARTASAHAQVVGSEPAFGAALTVSPNRILVRFSGPIEITLGSLRLYDAQGALFELGAPERPSGEAAAVAAAVRTPLSDGGYLVSYQVVSVDGHTIRGAYSFQVGTSAGAPSSELLNKLSAGPEGESTVRLLASAARLALFAGIAVAAGVLVMVSSIWPDGRNDRRTHNLLIGAASFGVLGAVVQMACSAANIAGEGVDGLVSGAGWKALLQTGIGKWWTARALAIGLFGGALVATRRSSGTRQWRLLAVAGAALTFFTMARSGHGSSGRWIALGIALTMVHLAAISVWVGGLIVLTLAALRRPDSMAAVRRFSSIALVSVVVVVLTGLAQGWRQVPTIADLREGDYGRTLITKTLVVAVLIGAGALSRVLVRRQGDTSVRVRDVMGMEVILSAGVLALTSSLVSLPPVPSRAPVTVNVTLTSANRLADVILEPAAVGPNTVHVTITNAGGGLSQPSSLTVRLTPPDDTLGPVSSPPTHSLSNHATFADISLTKKGTWQLEILARFGSEQVRFSTPVEIR